MKFASRLAALTLLVAAPVQAQQSPAEGRIEIDTNLFCDTAQQVERFVSLFDPAQVSADTAIDSVNAEQGVHDACVIATVAYRRMASVATVANSDASFHVTRVVVVGVYTGEGLQESMPTELFTLIPRDDEGGATVGQRP